MDELATRPHEELAREVACLHAAIAQIRENERDGWGRCRYCGTQDYPVDASGDPIPGPDVSGALEWWLDHADWCPVAILDRAIREIGEVPYADH